MPLKVEVFVSLPPCSGGRLLLKLVEEIQNEYADRIEVEVHKGVSDKLTQYAIDVSPAIVIDEDIQIIGVCPSKETFKSALFEAGV